MKSNPSHSAPLVPLAPPVGVSGVSFQPEYTLTQIADALPKDLGDSIRANGIKVEISNCKAALKLPPAMFRALLDHEHAAGVLPASPVKDTPATFVLNEPGDPICTRCGAHVLAHNTDEAGNVLCAATASPVDSVGVPAEDAVLIEKSWQKLKDGIAPHAVSIDDKLDASHAAKDAKIKALTDALKEAADTIQTLAKAAPYGVSMDVSAVHDRARAALALPSA